MLVSIMLIQLSLIFLVFCAYKFYSSTAAIIVSAVGLLQFDYQFSSCLMDRVMRNRFLCRQKSTVIRIFRLEKLNLLISKRASLEVSKAVVQSKHLTIEFYTVVMLLTVILIIISVPYHPSLFHSRLETFLFCKSFPPLAFLFFFRTDSTGSPDCFADTSEHTRFYCLVFFHFWLLVPRCRLS